MRAARWLLAAAAVSAAGCGREAPAPVVLVSVDTLRADHLGCYGYERPTSPALDRFAAESVLFADAVAPAPTTAPSHMSIFTSLYPPVHGV
ncbi:MAG TPA: sulfatase-like hydrolase/transferase, partial [bacterium]|nr:sulfatase-like hydrolase/transferase [bacterium]